MTDDDTTYMARAIALALDAERHGNLPIGALITLDGTVIAAAGNAILVPVYHPGRHAEMEALRQVPLALWSHSRAMTCYTTLEPCMMCFGALLLHGLGRIVFGATDPAGGATAVRGHLPAYYAGGGGVPAWVGPVASDTCAALYTRAAARFDQLPVVGRGDRERHP